MYFFLSGLSFTGTDDSQDYIGKERAIFISLYYLYPLTKIQIFICNLACVITTKYFYSNYM